MQRHKETILVALFAALLFLPFLGRVHLFDWDEINFAEISREMIATGEYSKVQINYEAFWEKPPLFCWLQVICMKIFGVNEFAARLPNAICGIITFVLIYLAGRKYFSSRTGWLWVLAYAGAFTPHLYFKSGIIDPVFNLFIVLGLYHLFRASMKRAGNIRYLHFRWSGFFIGLALLTKGPVALLIIGLCGITYWAISRFRFYFNWKDIAWFLLVFSCVVSVWLGMEVYNNGIGNLARFFVYQYELLTQDVATHGQPFYYHPLVLLLGCFPVSIIAIKGFGRIAGEKLEQKIFKAWAIVLFWVVLILFSIVRTKIVHYSSLCYLPLTFIAAYLIDRTLQGRIKFNRIYSVLLMISGILIAAALTLAGMFPYFRDGLLPYIKDRFAVANMSLDVAWGGYEWIPGAFYLIAVIAGCSMLLLNRLKQGFLILLLSTALCLQLFLFMVLPKVEQYSQGATVRFFESLQGVDCYVETIGFKSYAHLFYAKVKPGNRPESRDMEWLKHGPIDKPAYFATRIQRADDVSKLPGFLEVGREGGFVFFKRDPPASAAADFGGRRIDSTELFRKIIVQHFAVLDQYNVENDTGSSSLKDHLRYFLNNEILDSSLNFEQSLYTGRDSSNCHPMVQLIIFTMPPGFASKYKSVNDILSKRKHKMRRAIYYKITSDKLYIIFSESGCRLLTPLMKELAW